MAMAPPTPLFEGPVTPEAQREQLWAEPSGIPAMPAMQCPPLCPHGLRAPSEQEQTETEHLPTKPAVKTTDLRVSITPYTQHCCHLPLLDFCAKSTSSFLWFPHNASIMGLCYALKQKGSCAL